MNKVVLVFHSTTELAQFILEQRIRQAEVKTKERSLTAMLTQKQLITACKQYGAMLQHTLY